MDYDLISAKKHSKEYYDQINKQFYNVCYFGQKPGKPMFSKLIDYKKLKGKKVLEVGCGAGTISMELAKHGAKVTSVDLTPTAISNTKNQLKFNKLKGKVMEADAENLPFDDESFDYVWSWGVIHHTPNTRKCAKEIHRVLKKGGEANVMIYHKNSLFTYFIVYFIRGIVQGELFKKSRAQLLNKYTDHSHVGGTPLAKCYSKNESKKLFKEFNNIKFSTYGVRDEVYILPSLRKFCYKLPDAIPSFILETLGLGWYLFMKMKK